MTEINSASNVPTTEKPEPLENSIITPRIDAVADMPDVDHPGVATPATSPPPDAQKMASPRGTPIWLTGLVALMLIGGLVWVWQDRPISVASDAPPMPQASDAPRMAALEDALKDVQQRVMALEQRPAPDTGRVAALEKTVGSFTSRPVTDTSSLEQRLTALEQRPQPVMPDVASAVAGASAALNARIETLDAKLAQDMTQSTARAAQASRLRAAVAALQAGQPIGELADASPALARYARAAPPTEPALRETFATYASAAETASRPSAEGHDFAERMWMRAQTLVTVRQGSKVLVGAPAAVTLAASRGKLDAGDLAGAIAALEPLDAAATSAMAPWKSDAQALLDARTALSAMAAKS